VRFFLWLSYSKSAVAKLLLVDDFDALVGAVTHPDVADVLRGGAEKQRNVKQAARVKRRCAGRIGG
jgi:hypothetical protein